MTAKQIALHTFLFTQFSLVIIVSLKLNQIFTSNITGEIRCLLVVGIGLKFLECRF